MSILLFEVISVLKSFLGVFGPYTQFSCRVMRRFHQGTLAIFIFWLFLQAWLKTKNKVAQFFFIFLIQLMRNLAPPRSLTMFMLKISCTLLGSDYLKVVCTQF